MTKRILSKYTPIDCFFGDFAHWNISSKLYITPPVVRVSVRVSGSERVKASRKFNVLMKRNVYCFHSNFFGPPCIVSQLQMIYYIIDVYINTFAADYELTRCKNVLNFNVPSASKKAKS